MKKILVVHNYYQQKGGEDTVVKNEIELLSNKGHKIYLYTRNNKEIKKINRLRLFIDTIFSLKTFIDIRKIVEKDKIDVIHVHNTLPLISPSVYYAAISKQIPIIQTIHNFRMLCPNAVLYRNNEVCEKCIVKGLKTSLKYKCYRGSYIQTLVLVILLKIHRKIGIYNKINYIVLTDFNKEKLKNIVKNPNNIFVKPNFSQSSNNINFQKTGEYYLYVGRLEDNKGIIELLRNWQRISDKLIIIGDGPQKSKVVGLIENKKNILLKGSLEKQEVLEYMKNAKALIVPSKLYEGFPMVIVEAFSQGIPVIGNRIGNIQSIIKDEVNGYLFDLKNKDELLTVIKKIKTNNLEEMKKNIIIQFKKEYSEISNYEKLNDIYNKIIKKEK